MQFSGAEILLESLVEQGVDTVFGYPGGTIMPIYDALLKCWCAETCAPRMRERWSPENPTLGQCSVTAFLAQELFGGRVWGIPLPEGGFHCFNEACGGIFDLTSQQFGDLRLDYEHPIEQSRAEHFAKQEKYERYLLLRNKLMECIMHNA